MRNPAHRTALSALLICTSLFSTAAIAAEDCQTRIPALLQAAYPNATSETGDGSELLRLSGTPTRWINPDEVVCKVWPASPDKTLLAVKLQHAIDADQAVDEADLDLVVADSARDRIVQRHRQDGLLSSDAIRVSSFAFDTARYRLDDKTTAFGLRIHRSGSSRANPYGDETLRLYVIDGSGLRPVLRNLVMMRNQGEWDTRCAGEFTDTRRTISVDAKRDNGYAGLLLNTVASTSRSVAKGEDCDEVDGGTEKSSVRLRYDGREYVVPKDLRGFDDDYIGNSGS
ncbi:hypothetical protein [Lysobacter sp. Root690]|uniref:hypothetical protein n=1 Tax=Lysobacter sp. Root690 TaxID=1736588 RepID=UPI000A7F190B|nr:hypothetical protein [Lysobacter sp. Root690]